MSTQQRAAITRRIRELPPMNDEQIDAVCDVVNLIRTRHTPPTATATATGTGTGSDGADATRSKRGRARRRAGGRS